MDVELTSEPYTFAAENHKILDFPCMGGLLQGWWQPSSSPSGFSLCLSQLPHSPAAGQCEELAFPNLPGTAPRGYRVSVCLSVHHPGDADDGGAVGRGGRGKGKFWGPANSFQSCKIPGPSPSSQNRSWQRANFLASEGPWCVEPSCWSAGSKRIGGWGRVERSLGDQRWPWPWGTDSTWSVTSAAGAQVPCTLSWQSLLSL